MRHAGKYLPWLLMLVLGCPQGSANEGPGNTQDRGQAGGFNLWLNPGLYSYHLDRTAGFRSQNWGAGLQSNLREDVSVLAGSYINSDNLRSHYAGVAWQPLAWQEVRFGLVAGLLDGYPAMRNRGWFPAALPWVSIRGERIGVNLTYFPNFPHGVHAAFAAQLILRIW